MVLQERAAYVASAPIYGGTLQCQRRFCLYRSPPERTDTMPYDPRLRTAIHDVLAPDNIWELQASIRSLLSTTIARLPKGDVSKQERRYPTTRAGLRAFMDGFFARHYFQGQDSLLDYFASPAFSAIVRRGAMHIADVGCGPSVASLAILNMASVASGLIDGRPRGARPLTVNIVLNDTSEVCLDEGQELLDRYNRCRTSFVKVGRVLPLSTPFPKSIVQLRRIARMTTPFDMCCLGYVLNPLSEQVGVGATAEGILQLAQAGNTMEGQLLLTQDKFSEDLHRQICRVLGVSAEVVDLKQRVYDSQNQNDEQTYTYCRSCSHITELKASRDSAGVV